MFDKVPLEDNFINGKVEHPLLITEFPFQTETQCLAQITKTSGVAIGQSETWTDSIMLPPMPSSQLRNCNYIDMDYYLAVRDVRGKAPDHVPAHMFGCEQDTKILTRRSICDNK